MKKENMSLEDLKKSWISKIEGTCVFISATKKINIDELREKLIGKVKEIHFKRYPNYFFTEDQSSD
jgi:GTP-binding protein HflX